MHLQQLRGMQCFELGICKRCHLSIVGIQKHKGVGPRGGACKSKTLLSEPRVLFFFLVSCETRPKETLLCSITTYLPYLINLLQLLPNSVQTYVIDMRRRKNAIRLKRGKIRSRREAWGSKKKTFITV